MKKRLAIFFILLLIFSNISTSLVYAQIFRDTTRDPYLDPRFDRALADPRLRYGYELTGERITLGTEEERGIGEDIIINIDNYEPRQIRSSLIEEQDVQIRALLIGTPSNPSITIPRIRSVDPPKRVNVTTVPAGKKVSIGSIRWFPPTGGLLGPGRFGLTSLQYRLDPTYRNLGYLVIPVRRIPKEEDVPSSIDIEVETRVNFDVSQGLGFGPSEDILIEQKEDEWLREKDQHSFFGGFIRADKIESDRATFVLYDNNLKPLDQPIVIREGTARSFRLPGGYSRFGNLFDNFIIRVNDIREITDKAKVLILREGTSEFSTRVLTKGSSLYPGSNWVVRDIKFENNDTIRNVILGNVRTGKTATLSMTQVVCENLKKEQCDKESICNFVGDKCVERVTCQAIKDKTECESNNQCQYIANICLPKEIIKGPNACKLANGVCREESSCLPNEKKIGEGEEIGCPPPALDFEQSSVSNLCCVPLKKEEKDYNELASEYDNIDKKDINALKKVISELKEIIGSEINLNVRVNAFNLLKTRVINDVRKLSQELLAEKGKDSQEFKDVEVVLTDLVDYIGSGPIKEGRPETVRPKEEIQTVNDLYKLAIQAYTQLIKNFPDQKDGNNQYLSVEAQERIATINYILGDTEGAIRAYEDLLANPRFDKEKNVIIQRISNLRGLLTNFGTKPEKLEDVGEDIIVKLEWIKKASRIDQPKAVIEIEGIDRRFNVGDILYDTDKPEYKWKINSITERNVIIRRDFIDKDGRSRSESITLTNALRSFEVGKDKPIRVRVKDIEIKREAHISILPETETAFSEASFTIHLDIDKRAIRPSIFSSNLDKEINKTMDLIKKVDNLITRMEKIHKFWINFCYITFGSLWAKNLLQGVFTNEGIARQKIRDKWVEEYNEERKKGFTGTFDNFVINNADKYSKDIEAAGKIIDSMKDLSTCKENLPQEIEKVGDIRKIKNENLLRDHCFAFGMSKYDPRYKRQALDTEFNIRLAFVSEKVDELSKKKFDEIKEELKTITGREYKREEFLLNKDKILATYNDLLKIRILGEYFYNDPNIDALLKDPTIEKGRLKQYIDSICQIRGGECIKDAINDIKEQLSKVIGLGPIVLSPFSVIGKENEVRRLVEPTGKFELFTDSGCKEDNKLETDIKLKEKYFVKKPTGCEQVTFGDPRVAIAKHNPRLSIMTGGPAKGLIESISASAMLYAQIDYSTGGAIKGVTIFRRNLPNDPLGTGIALGNINDILSRLCDPKIIKQQGVINENDCKGLRGLDSKIRACNNELSRRTFETGAPLRCGYIKEDVRPTEIGKSCVDFMSPTDCRILFNACDPVLCPSSRCNFGGRWQVRDVVQTGIIGSLVLCAPNSVLTGGEVVVPVCITGLLAGLQNIKSMLQGYAECLNVQKVKGESVGICDRIRNIYLCDILWREGVAIFNIKGGILGILSDKLFDVGKGGGEYANFKGAIDNSISGLRFFTQDYAKNVFAAYAGGSLEEIGTEICKSFVGGKLPGPGFFDQITRPVSPPQFIAFFDSLPYTEIGAVKQNQYSVFHHIYAGANEPISYSVYLRALDETGRSYLPFYYLIRNRRLDAGRFNEENNDFVTVAGYNEICVEIQSRLQGRRVECGFGKVTTDFGLGFLSDAYTAREAQKRITSAEECQPEQGRLTNIEYSGQGVSGAFTPANYQGGIDITRALVGTVSTGLTQTGIIRKCSGFNPGIGVNPGDWVEVGTCGKDDKDRDLGLCWLYRPAVNRLIKDTEFRNETEVRLKEIQEKLASEGLLGFNVLSAEESVNLLNEANGLFDKLKIEGNEEGFKKVVELYQRISTNTLIDNIAARALFKLGNSYEEWAKFRKKGEEFIKAIEEEEKCPALITYDADEESYMSDKIQCPNNCGRQEGCFCGLTRKYVTKGDVCGKENDILSTDVTGLTEEIRLLQTTADINNINAASTLEIAEEAPRYYKYVNGQWIRVDEERLLDLRPREVKPPEPEKPRELSPEQLEKISKFKKGITIKEEDITFIFGYRPIIGEDLKILSVFINEGKATAVGVKSGLLYSYDLDSWSIVEDPDRCIVNKVFWDKVEIKDDEFIYLKDKGERVPPIKEGEPVFLHIISQGKKCLGQNIITRFYSKEINPFSVIPTLYTHPLNINVPEHIPEEDEARTYKIKYGFVTIGAWTSDVRICGKDINLLSNCGKTITENVRDAIPLFNGRNIFIFKIDKGPKDAEEKIPESNDLYVEPIKNLEISIPPIQKGVTGVDFKIPIYISHPFEYLQDYQIKQETLFNGRKEPLLGGFESAKYSELYTKGFIEEGPYNIQQGVLRKHTIRIPALFFREGELKHKVTVTYYYQEKEYKIENSITINIVKGECEFKEAYWANEIGGELKRISRAFEGQEVTMVVKTENCGSKALYLKIGDADYIPSIGSALGEGITITLPVSLRDNKVQESWKITKNVCGGISCERSPSSLIFYVVENRESLTSNKQSNHLKVEEIKQYTPFLYYNRNKRIYENYYFDLDKNLYKLDKSSNIWVKINEDTNEYINVVNSKEGKDSLEKVERIITNR